MGKNSFYVTTPIYYGTAKPHLGSLYSTLIADVIARWQKIYAEPTYFLTGTDEHGQKIAQAAARVGKSPQEFVDSFIAPYKETWQLYNIEYQQFIRTTDSHHIRGVQYLIQKLVEKGDIYKGSYDGWYCTPCETYVNNTSKEAPQCPSCERETVAVAEESYFFKLSKYQDALLAWYKANPHFIVPKERANEVISFVEAGLKDLSISRTTITWGVPFPNDPKHVVYVWIDALCNYITAVGYGDTAQQNMFEKWWPCNLHVLGKDIVRFHAVYWPALLMAAGVALPKKLLVHGWIQINQQKMSKSRGNTVDPIDLVTRYGADPVRYYLLRQMPFNGDGEFSIADLEMRTNADLSNDLGNLLNRAISLADRYSMHMIEPVVIWNQKAIDLRDAAYDAIEAYTRHMNSYECHLAIALMWKFINKVNAYFHEQEPWKVVKQDKDLFVQIISATCHSLRTIAILLWPIMPERMMILLKSMGCELDLNKNNIESLTLGSWNQTFVLQKVPTLFQKIEDEMTENKTALVEERGKEKKEYITLDDFTKVDLLVGTILSAESVVGSEKLIKLQVDFGSNGTKQILAGVRKWYHPEDLLGKQGIFVTNLKPRKIVGQESQGMMLFAEDEGGKLHPVNPEGVVPSGTRLR